MKDRNNNCNPLKNPATRGMLPVASAAAQLIFLSVRKETAGA
jgi:hypothetical protein